MQEPNSLPKLIVERWIDAGAVSGWIDCYHLFSTTPLDECDLPAFLFKNRDWDPARLSELPDPGIPFGLQLHSKTADQDLKLLAALTSLDTLIAGDTRITGHGLKDLSVLPRLRILKLCVCAIGDAPLKHLCELKSLLTLDLSDTEISDAGLNYLGPMSNLQNLDLTRTGITDDGLANLATLTNLQALRLEETQVTGVGFRNLGGLPNLPRHRRMSSPEQSICW